MKWGWKVEEKGNTSSLYSRYPLHATLALCYSRSGPGVPSWPACTDQAGRPVQTKKKGYTGCPGLHSWEHESHEYRTIRSTSGRGNITVWNYATCLLSVRVCWLFCLAMCVDFPKTKMIKWWTGRHWNSAPDQTMEQGQRGGLPFSVQLVLNLCDVRKCFINHTTPNPTVSYWTSQVLCLHGKQWSGV